MRTHDERAAGRVARRVVLGAGGRAGAGPPVALAHRGAAGAPAGADAGGGLARRSCPCPIPTTCASGSRRSTAPPAARTRTTWSPTSSGASDMGNPARAGGRPPVSSRRSRSPWRSGRLGRALLLNASFEPLCVVPMRRAVVLVLKEKAEIVARNGAVLHSEKAELPVPAVIRLHHFVRVPYRNRVPAVAPGGLRPRRPPLPVLQPGGREHRPRGATVARGPARLGQRGGLVPGLQLPEGGPPPLRGRLPPPANTQRTQGEPLDRRQRRLDRPRLGALSPRVARLPCYVRCPFRRGSPRRRAASAPASAGASSRSRRSPRRAAGTPRT